MAISFSCFNGLPIKATTFVARTSAPDSNNAYYYSNMNPYYASGYAPGAGLDAQGNCTWYAWGRAYEILGRYPSGLSLGNATQWWSQSNGFAKGSTPKLGAVMCWSGGHIAVVEAINGNNMTISESSYKSYSFPSGLRFQTKTMSIKAQEQWNYGFQGYIYITESLNSDAVSILYTSHVQDYGWQSAVSNGATSGTVGKGKRIEAISLSLKGVSGGISYRSHIQGIGWESADVSNGTISGTVGKGLRLEAIKIHLTGKASELYDIYYRVHAQNIGWMGWATNGEAAGTQGCWYHLEALQVVLVPKGHSAPGSTASSFVVNDTKLTYRSHVQSIGWQSYVNSGELSGTSGLSKRMEAVQLSMKSGIYNGDVSYETHVQSIGWQGWRTDDAIAGTTGMKKRIEAIKIQLSGELSQYYDIYYRVHVQSIGWMNWATNGEAAGTQGLGLRMEAMQVQIKPKGSSKPVGSGIAFKSK